MTKTELTAIRTDLIAALDTIAETHGLTMSLGGMTYDDAGFRTKITAHRGSAEDAERAEFERYAPRFGVTAAHFGHEFALSNGKRYRPSDSDRAHQNDRWSDNPLRTTRNSSSPQMSCAGSRHAEPD